MEYVDSIMVDVNWLGCRLGRALLLFRRIISIRFTNSPIELVRKGKAYVCDMTRTRKDTDEYRRPGKDSPFRNRSAEENLDLLRADEGGRIPGRARTASARRST